MRPGEPPVASPVCSSASGFRVQVSVCRVDGLAFSVVTSSDLFLLKYRFLTKVSSSPKKIPMGSEVTVHRAPQQMCETHNPRAAAVERRDLGPGEPPVTSPVCSSARVTGLEFRICRDSTPHTCGDGKARSRKHPASNPKENLPLCGGGECLVYMISQGRAARCAAGLSVCFRVMV